jgi:hypothetical protein
MGYFDKIRRADVFVFLDGVDYPRAGSGGMGSWTNRVRINIRGEPYWLGCPVAGYSGRKSICDVQIAEDGKWRGRLLRTLEMNYKRSLNYATAMALIQPLIENPISNLSEYNMTAILGIAEALELKCEFRRQTDMPTAETSTLRLIEIVKSVGADAYLTGGGAGGYQDDALFAAQDVAVQYQNFVPRPYGDPEKFIAGLSIVDFLMNARDWSSFAKADGDV